MVGVMAVVMCYGGYEAKYHLITKVDIAKNKSICSQSEKGMCVPMSAVANPIPCLSQILLFDLRSLFYLVFLPLNIF